MTDRHKNIITGIVSVFIPLIYLLGMLQWQKNEVFTPEIGRAIYAKCAFSVMYIMSFLVFLWAKSKPTWVKPITAGSNSFFALVLYQEIVHKNTAWHTFSYWLIVIISANYFILYLLIDKVKKHYNYD